MTYGTYRSKAVGRCNWLLACKCISCVCMCLRVFAYLHLDGNGCVCVCVYEPSIRACFILTHTYALYHFQWKWSEYLRTCNRLTLTIKRDTISYVYSLHSTHIQHHISIQYSLYSVWLDEFYHKNEKTQNSSPTHPQSGLAFEHLHIFFVLFSSFFWNWTCTFWWKETRSKICYFWSSAC